MRQLINLLTEPLGWVLRCGYVITGNYGLAVLFFALAAKIVMFPLVLLAQKNSIRLIQLQPDLEYIKRVHFGDKNRINEEQYELYKRERYSPVSGLLPLFAQLFLLVGMINVIYEPDKYITGLTAGDLFFCGIELSVIPLNGGLPALIVLPLLSGLSSYLLCLVQNHINPAQRRLRFWGKWGMSVFIIAFSFYFPIVTRGAVGLYWFYNNALSIAVAFCANAVYNPKKLAAPELLLPPVKVGREERLRQRVLRRRQAELSKESVKRFNAEPPDKLVFYAVSGGQYKYFSEIIDYILNNSGMDIHYVTNDFSDRLLTQERKHFKTYYIGEKPAVMFMLRLDAKMVIMTAPNLQQYHIKRSIVRTDIEYIYTYHHFTSLMLLREGALDYFDTVFCTGEHQIEEIRRTEQLYGLPPKKLIKAGYGQMDKLLRMRSSLKGTEHLKEGLKRRILIAPTWSEGNILDNCLNALVELLADDYQLIIRPHPEYIKRFPEKWDAVKSRFNHENLSFDTEFLSNDSIYQSDILITDWSSIAYEFSYCTKHPSIFINTPMKVMNSEYFKLGIEPVDITLRGCLGVSVDTDKLDGLRNLITDMLNNPEKYRASIEAAFDKYLFYPGRSGEAAGKYIISRFII